MVAEVAVSSTRRPFLSVLALSSRFDGRESQRIQAHILELSVLALSSRFDGRAIKSTQTLPPRAFSTRSVESF